MDEDISWIKLVRYVRGESDPEEQAEVREWIASDTDHEDIILFVEKLLETSAEAKEDWDVDSAWLRYNIRHGRDFDEDTDDEAQEFDVVELQSRSAGAYRREKTGAFKWASVAIAAAMIGLIVFFTIPVEKESVSGEQSQTLKEIVSDYGQRTHFRLSDGTRVILNAGSKIKTPETFSDSVRSIQLEGQAFFDVSTDSARPFLVNTDRSVTEVLGTKFDIQAYPEDEQVEVTVAEGKVALRAKQDTTNLKGKEITKNQKGSLSPTGVASVSEVQDLAVHVGWTEGKLVFSNEPFVRVKTTLERWYNIEIESDNSDQLNRRRFTGSFTDSQPMEEVLEAIALSLNMKYKKTISDRTYTIYE